MAQAREGHSAAANVVEDYGAIRRVLELCTEGEAKDDVEKLKEAFHADAHMFGSLAGGHFDGPIDALHARARQGKEQTTVQYHCTLL